MKMDDFIDKQDALEVVWLFLFLAVFTGMLLGLFYIVGKYFPG